MTQPAILRPKLTMPAPEAKLLRLAYAEAGVILEYGSGGSTVVAAEMAGKTVFSVESDANWLAMMQQYFAENPPVAKVVMQHGDIGPTRAWGFPANKDKVDDWPKYPLEVWDLPEFVHPDVVLIDGRFRPACFLSVLFRITRPTLVLWDDYKDRRYYHKVEDLVKPAEFVGRMALFELTPMAVPADRLLWVIQTYLLAR